MRSHPTKNIEWSGRICAVCTKKSVLYFATGATHTSKGRLVGYDLRTSSYRSMDLPDRAHSIVATEGGIAAVLADGRLWLADETTMTGNLAPPLISPVRALAPLTDGRIAALTPDRMAVIDLNEKQTAAASSMPDSNAPTRLATHPRLQRIAVGLEDGTLLSFKTVAKETGSRLELESRRALAKQISGPLSFDARGDILVCRLSGSVMAIPWNSEEGSKSWRQRFVAPVHVTAAPSGHIYLATRSGKIWHLGKNSSGMARAADERLCAVAALDIIHHDGEDLLVAAEENGRFLFFGLDRSGRVLRPRLELMAKEEEALDSPFAPKRIAAVTQPVKQAESSLAQVCAALPFEPKIGLPMLKKLLRDPRPSVRMDAFWLAASLYAPLRDALRAAPETGEPMAFVVQHCFEHGAAFPEPFIQDRSVAVGILLEAITTGFEDIRLEAAHAMMLLKDRRCAGTLLELSGSATSEIRRRACVSMGLLDEPLFLSRLETLLEDPQPEVRSAAYASLEKILSHLPLDVSQRGSTSGHSDVRLAALRTLDASLQASLSERMPPRALALLERGLGDDDFAVRETAFDILVGRIGRGDEKIAVNLAISSYRPDIRERALALIEQELSRPWAYTLILELFDDPDPSLRRRAVSTALERRDRPDGEQVRRCLERAIQSKYKDVRCAAISHLPGSNRRWTLKILLRALDDTSSDVRNLAMDNLEKTASSDPGDTMIVAMNSRYPDVRVRAARLRAHMGDTLAFAPLVRQLRVPAPSNPKQRAFWRKQMLLAIEGVEPLESSEVSDRLRDLLEGDDVIIRHRAARALAWTAPADDLASFRGTLTHPDPTVQVIASAALTWRGVPLEITSLRRCDDDDTLEVAIAALFVGDARLFARLYEHHDPLMRLFAVATAVFSEKRRGMCGELVTIALGSPDPLVRYRAARAIEPGSVTSQHAFDTLIDPLEKGTSSFVGATTRERIARAIVHGKELLAARMLKLLAILAFEGSERFEQSYELLASRHKDALSELELKNDKVSNEAAPTENRLPLCLGIYTGLATNEKDVPSEHRLAAVRRLICLTHQERLKPEDVSQALDHCLFSDDPETRRAAFDGLQELGCPPHDIIASALASGHRDTQSRGLRLLFAEPGGMSQIRMILSEYTDGLEHEAYAVLAEREGRLEADRFAIDASSASLRDRVLEHLTQREDPSGLGTEILRSALASRFDSVRLTAAEGLLRTADDSAFETLLRLSMRGDIETKKRAVELLGRFSSPQSADALYEQLDQSDPDNPIVPKLLESLGRCATPRHLTKILSFTDHPATQEAATEAVLAIIPRFFADAELDVDRAASIVVSLIEKARSNERLLAHIAEETLPLPNENLAATLFKLAGHQDAAVQKASLLRLSDIIPTLPAAQVMAQKLVLLLKEAAPVEVAQALALTGDPSGAPALRRASRGDLSYQKLRDLVQALKSLGYPEGTAILVEAARGRNLALALESARALGSMVSVGCPDSLIEDLAELTGLDEPVARPVLEGLRRCDHQAAWSAIRAATSDKKPAVRSLAVQLLAFDDAPASRACLEHLIEHDPDPGVVLDAACSLRGFYEKDSLEPDRLYVKSERARARTEPVVRLAGLESLPRLFALSNELVSPEWRLICEQFAWEMNKRSSLSEGSLVRALKSEHSKELFVAATLCGSIAHLLSPNARQAIEEAVVRVRNRWDALCDSPEGRNLHAAAADFPPATVSLASAYSRLIWCCGRLGLTEEEIIHAAFCSGPGPLKENIQYQAALALADSSRSHAATEALAALASAANPKVRDVAASALARVNPTAAAQLAHGSLDDRPSLMRLLDSGERHWALTEIRRAATNPKVLGSAGPILVSLEDVEGLAAIAMNRETPRTAQITAVEALGDIGTEAAREPLVECASSDEVEPLIRRIAFRSLRRMSRTKKKTFTPRGLRGGESQ